MDATSADVRPLCLTVSLRLRAGEEERAAEIVQQLAQASRTEPGCLIYNVHRSLDDPRRFFIYEVYKDTAALEAHRASPHFANLATTGLYPLVEERQAELHSAVAVA